MKIRIIILLIAVFGGLSVAGIALLVKNTAPAKPRTANTLIAVTEDAFGGPFTLTDHNGNSVTNKDYDGKYRLIYFGFTYCPAICPTELSKMTATLNTLGDAGADILPLFITVDPERDTVEIMKNYVSMFHPSFVGLTGTTEQISKTLKDYKIYAAKRQDETMTEYTMDHSSFIYFIAPNGQLLHIFKIQDDADMMAQTIQLWLTANNK